MSFLKKYKYYILAFAAVALTAVAVLLFVSSGDGAEKHGNAEVCGVQTAEMSETNKEDSDIENAVNDKKSETEAENSENGVIAETTDENVDKTGQEKAVEKTVQNSKSELGAVSKSKNEKNESSKADELVCTISVSCGTILDNMGKLTAGKAGLVPKDGIILSERKVEFFEGESVFNLLLRELKKNKIHMEFHKTPVYNSAYIEGINNIYEFDCGELSGWMYRVNGEFPSYGCSRYILKSGDRVEWLYTCDLGADIGSEYITTGAQNDE